MPFEIYVKVSYKLLKKLKARNRYSVKVSVKDLYDFKKINQGIIKSAINNLGGYYPQETGLLKPYYWKFKRKFKLEI